MSLCRTGICEEMVQLNGEESTFVLRGGLQYVVHGQAVFDQRDGIREALLRAAVARRSVSRRLTSLRLLGQSAPVAL